MEKLESNDFYAKFILVLRDNVPKRGNLCRMLTDILNIERISVYRRLRGEVPFTLEEIVKISRRLNISLDSLMGVTQPYRSFHFNLHHQDFFRISDIDIKMANDYVIAIDEATSRPYSEYGCATNFLPLHSLALHEPIYRFFILKWMYQFGGPDQALPYSEIVIPKRLRDTHHDYIKAVQKVKYSYFIYHDFFMSHVIHDIKYFREIRLVDKEDIELLRETLEKSLKAIDHLLKCGCFDNGNRIDFYLSGLNFETSYQYLYAENCNISMVDAFTLGSLASLDSKASELMRRWMYSLRRTSTLLSSTEKNRILFIDKQKRLLDTLAPK